jgi:hypothetical protein
MRALAAAALLAALLPGAEAQWAQTPDPAVRRLADGSPDLAARTPKARGKPDLTGVWAAETAPVPAGIPTVEGVEQEFPRFMINGAADTKPEDVQMLPWAAELFQQRLNATGDLGPTANCRPTGVPALNSVPLPFKIVQTPRLIVILSEENMVYRQIFLDGRKPVEDPVPRYMGYSTGRWEGDTLVVDTVGFHDKHWLDGMGHPHSDGMHLVERYRRPDAGHLEVEVTIDDPRTYGKPLRYTVKSTLLADDDLLEYFCTDNEKDIQHYR